MLHEFLAAHRNELVERCREKVALRSGAKATDEELENGIPRFLDQLTKTLKVEQTAEPMLSRKVSGPAGGGKQAQSEISKSAALHGGQLLHQGFTVEQVVHDYGDLCQSITDLSFELDTPIEIDEFRTLNRCLDNGIAVAVTEYIYQRDTLNLFDQSALNERFGAFAHELRNLLNTALLAHTAIKTGNVGLSGATGGVLDRSLVGLRKLIDRYLTDVRLLADCPTEHHLFSLAHFITEVKLSASLEAQSKECTLTVATVEPLLAVEGDRDLLFAAVGNLLQNAFKFTHHGSEVTLTAYGSADRILIDVEDHCGGLPHGFAEKMFSPFTQGGNDKSGLGLGLSIAQRSVEESAGILSVRDLPGAGCIFTIDLPRHSLPETPIEEPVENSEHESMLCLPVEPLPELSERARALKLLIAEDDATNRKLLALLLKRLGLSATIVENGQRAAAYATSEYFDVIFMDCRMPVLDGYEATRKIRLAEKDFPDRKPVPIIALSAAALNHDRIRAEESGMDGYLTKPIDPNLLAASLEAVAAGEGLGPISPSI